MTSKTHILVVEDEGIIAKDLQAMLRSLGYHVPVTVGTGEQAINIALQNRPDLILMDIQLRGGMDGVQAATAINAQQDVPIIYLTANSDEPTLQRAKATGPFGFLVKPFEERAIQAGIEMALYKHKTDRQMREREQWLSTTLTSIADAVITTDGEGRITFLNAAAERLSGHTRTDAEGRPYGDVFRIIDEATRLAPADRIAQALQEGATGQFSNHTLLLRPDGDEVHIEHSVAPIRQGVHQEVAGSVIVFSDVGERKKLEEQLRQVQKMDAVGKLAGGIAHDFNNAITAILGYAEMILLKVQERDPFFREASQIVRAAEHSARLTHQLLAFSRKQVLQPRALDLQHEIAQIEGMIRRLIGENVELVSVTAPDLWKPLVDPGQVEQVVLNMAINARDAMPKGGRLTVELANVTVSPQEAQSIPEGRPGEYVVIKISDTGTGMSREVLNQIFEPFFTTKGAGKGTGLGLATCYGIVRQTSGLITVASELNKGTTFSVYLPRAGESAAEEARPPAQKELPRGMETILLVEDEEVVRELGVQVLESLGYRVLAACDGEEALEVLRSGSAAAVDLVVTDVMMPRLTGRELAAILQREFGKMRVLFISGYTDDEIIKNAIAGAHVDYLQKPFTMAGLAAKVREVLHRHQASNEA